MNDKTLLERLLQEGVVCCRAGPAEVADILHEAATHIKALEAALQGMCEAYKLVCDDAGTPYYNSPVSKYASAIKLLEGSGND